MRLCVQQTGTTSPHAQVTVDFCRTQSQSWCAPRTISTMPSHTPYSSTTRIGLPKCVPQSHPVPPSPIEPAMIAPGEEMCTPGHPHILCSTATTTVHPLLLKQHCTRSARLSTRRRLSHRRGRARVINLQVLTTSLQPGALALASALGRRDRRRGMRQQLQGHRYAEMSDTPHKS